MSNDQPPAGAAPPGGKGRRRQGRRRPPTIELTATEVENRPDSSTVPEPAATAKDTPTTAPAADGAAEQTKAADATPDAGVSAEMSAAETPPQTETQRPQTDPASSTPGAGTPGAGMVEPPPPRNARLWPLIAAGAVGGALVAIVLGTLSWFVGRDSSLATLEARLNQVEQELRDVSARPSPAGGDARVLEDLRNRLAGVETALASPRPAPLDPAVANRVSAIEGEVKALAEQIGIAARRSDEAVATAREARARAEATAAALVELTQKVEHPAVPVVQRSELESLVGRVAAVEQAEKTLAGELAKRAAEGSDRTGLLAIAASALNAAVERGAPFASELATAKALTADPKMLEALEPFAAAGVPSAPTLARDLAALVPALQQAAGTSSSEGGFLEKLQANAEKLVRIRPLGEAAGSDPAAIVARIEFKAMHADLTGALAELATLPPTARAPAEAWIKQAQARAAALEASRRLVADALAGLSK
jgi:hypothetical protein